MRWRYEEGLENGRAVQRGLEARSPAFAGGFRAAARSKQPDPLPDVLLPRVGNTFARPFIDTDPPK